MGERIMENNNRSSIDYCSIDWTFARCTQFYRNWYISRVNHSLNISSRCVFMPAGGRGVHKLRPILLAHTIELQYQFRFFFFLLLLFKIINQRAIVVKYIIKCIIFSQFYRSQCTVSTIITTVTFILFTSRNNNWIFV